MVFIVVCSTVCVDCRTKNIVVLSAQLFRSETESSDLKLLNVCALGIMVDFIAAGFQIYHGIMEKVTIPNWYHDWNLCVLDFIVVLEFLALSHEALAQMLCS